jgi:hypothetical protein
VGALRDRFSDAPPGFDAPRTVTIETPAQRPPGSVVCPQQTGRTESCSTYRRLENRFGVTLDLGRRAEFLEWRSPLFRQ